MMYELNTTNRFEKELKKSKKRGKKLSKLEKVVNVLQQGEQLELKYKNHRLVGNFEGVYECHIEPDWLLVYRISGSRLILERLGSHSDIFG